MQNSDTIITVHPLRIRIKKFLLWVVTNAAVWGCAWLATEGSSGAGHLLGFYSYLCAIVSVITLGSDNLHRKAKMQGSSVPVWLNVTADVVLTGWLVWHGWLHIGIVFFCGCLCGTAIHTTEPGNKYAKL